MVLKISAIIILITLIMTAFSAYVFASDGQTNTQPDMQALFDADTFVTDSGYSLKYRIYLPQNYSAENKYPVLLFMHGAGERGDDNSAQLNVGIAEMFKKRNSGVYDCIVIAPQCPAGEKWVNVEQWLNCTYSTDDIAESAALAAVVELIGSIKDTYSTDTDRYYVTGLSMGGYATWDMLVRHPEIFAAAIPVCGGADYRKADVIKDIPIWTFHGLKDTTVPYDGTEMMTDALKALGANDVTYVEYPEMGHSIWNTVYARDDIYEWLFAQNKENVDEQNVDSQEQTSDTVTANDTQVTRETEIDTAEELTESGCNSAFGAVGAVMATVGVCAVSFNKRKNK